MGTPTRSMCGKWHLAKLKVNTWLWTLSPPNCLFVLWLAWFLILPPVTASAIFPASLRTVRMALTTMACRTLWVSVRNLTIKHTNILHACRPQIEIKYNRYKKIGANNAIKWGMLWQQITLPWFKIKHGRGQGNSEKKEATDWWITLLNNHFFEELTYGILIFLIRS